MENIDYAALAANLIAQSRELLPRWFPNGRWHGREFVVGSLQGETGESLSVNSATGVWKDFAGDGGGGDLTSLYAALNHLTQSAAARELLGLPRTNGANGHRQPLLARSDPIPPFAPVEASEPPPHSVNGPHSACWRYQIPGKEGIAFLIARYEQPEGKKTFCQWTWDGARWIPKGYPKPRPLYRLMELAASPGMPVLLVEGEKSADAAARVLMAHVAVSWPGGCGAVEHVDWSPLVGRTVVLWPDADVEGGKAMVRIAAKLVMLGCRLSRIDVSSRPAKWDVADAVAQGEVIQALLAGAVALEAPATEMVVSPPLEAYADEEDSGEAGLSDHELALRFSERHKDQLRYVASWDKWLIWDGKRWAPDEKRQVFDLSRKLCNDVLAEHFAGEAMTSNQRAALRKRLGSAQTVYAVTKLAGNDQRYHAVTVAQLDSNPWELNTPGGIVDLRTGLVCAHDPARLHTKITAAEPKGECPQFMKILARAQPDEEIRQYLQRVFGYGMTGSSRDHALSFWYGSGRNGKGTIAHAFRHAMGDYGLEVGSELFMESHNDRHPTEIAVLRGARFIAASEIDTGRKWNEARLKRLTGGDPISARYIGKDLFEFEPSHTLVIVGNQKPGLRSVDEAMRARMHLVDFAVTVPVEERDLELPEKLRAEYGGILAWALLGCLEWQRTGLRPPTKVLEATSEYLDGEDSVANWISECCLKTGTLTLSAAHRSYREWCEQNAATVLGRNTFGDQLETHGFRRLKDEKGKRSVTFQGLSLPIKEDRWTPGAEKDDGSYERDALWPKGN